MSNSILISDFQQSAPFVSQGTTAQGHAYEIYELGPEQADAISLATVCADGVVNKSAHQIIEHFDNGGSGLAIFIDNNFAGQVLIKENEIPASDIHFSPTEHNGTQKMSKIPSSHTIKVSTVSAIAPTPVVEHQVKGYSFPLMDAWYAQAVQSKCNLLQACVQADNTKGYNMFKRNQFVTDEAFYQSPSGSHDVYFMYRTAVSSLEFDTRHDETNEQNDAIPSTAHNYVSLPSPTLANCC